MTIILYSFCLDIFERQKYDFQFEMCVAGNAQNILQMP